MFKLMDKKIITILRPQILFIKTCGYILSYDVASGSDIRPCIKIDKPLVFVLFDLILYVPSTIFSYKGTGLPGLNQY